MGRSSSSGGSGSSRNTSKGPVAPPSVQTKKVNKLRDRRIVDINVRDITKKQINEPTRMQGGADHKQVWNAVAKGLGNVIRNKKGMPIKDSSGQYILNSKGKREFDKAMKRVPLSQAQRESQTKAMSIISLPLFFVPGGGLIRRAAINRMKDQDRIFTYGGGELSEEQVAEIKAQKAEKGAPPGTKVKRTIPKRKTFIDYAFGKPNQALGTGGNF